MVTSTTRRYCEKGHIYQTKPTFEPCCDRAGVVPEDRTHCPQEHRYSNRNTLWYRDQKYCRKCRRHRAKQKAYDRKAKVRGFIRLRDGGRCRYCGEEGSEVDHVVPRCNGGTDDAFSNLVWSCHRCNSAKGGRLGFTMKQERLYWHNQPIGPHELWGAELLSLLQD